MSVDITQVTELAKQGGRLASEKQWILADALAELNEKEITQVAIAAKRKESTLLQYARAAERWHPVDRVEGVSFSAHRVALSHEDPRRLLKELKEKFGSPTVQQVRQAMGLEGHPAVEAAKKMISKIDNDTPVSELRGMLQQVVDILGEGQFIEEVEEVEVEEVEVEEKQEDTRKGKWTPPVRSSDIAGI